MNDIDLAMHDLTAAAHMLITDWADVQVRGYLKEHPDIVENRLERLERALERIRLKVDAERAANVWPGRVAEPDLDFNTAAMDYAEHSCNCEWCLCCEPAGFGDGPIVLMTISASDMTATCPTCQSPPGDPCRSDGQVIASHPARISPPAA